VQTADNRNVVVLCVIGSGRATLFAVTRDLPCDDHRRQHSSRQRRTPSWPIRPGFSSAPKSYGPGYLLAVFISPSSMPTAISTSTCGGARAMTGRLARARSWPLQREGWILSRHRHRPSEEIRPLRRISDPSTWAARHSRRRDAGRSSGSWVWNGSLLSSG